MIYPWQNAQWTAFKQQYRAGRLPHACMLVGLPGLGKWHFATEMAAAILCINRQQGEACGQCHSCRLFKAGHHPDHSVIQPEDEKQQIKIDQIRELKDKQALTPAVSRWKTVILSPAEQMNRNSSNSLLKLLEEPQNNTLFILVASRSGGLPVTILSRCQKMIFTPPEPDLAMTWLRQHYPDMDNASLEKVHALAGGAPLRTLALLDSEILAQLQQIDTDFEQLLRGEHNPVQLAQLWKNWDLEQVLHYLQILVQNWILAQLKSKSQQKIRMLWQVQDCIQQTIKLHSSSNNINKILLLEQFMVSVMRIYTEQTVLNGIDT